MKVLVIGATGVIGRRLVPLLLREGHRVTALVRSDRGVSTAPGLGLVQGDLFEPEHMLRAMARQNAVINLATAMPSAVWKMAFRRAWRMNDRIRSEGVANLVHCAALCGVDTFIQESFAFAYPDCGDDWVSEEISLTPSSYNRTLLDAERSIARFRSSGGRGIVLRFAAFYGPDAIQTREMISWVRRGVAPLAGRREAFIPSVSHDDAAAAVAAALHASPGVYNVGDEEPVTHATFFNTLARALGVPGPRLLPGWSKHFLGSVSEAMARSIRLSSAKLRAETAWQPRWPSVVEAWPQVLEQLRKNDV